MVVTILETIFYSLCIFLVVFVYVKYWRATKDIKTLDERRVEALESIATSLAKQINNGLITENGVDINNPTGK